MLLARNVFLFCRLSIFRSGFWFNIIFGHFSDKLVRLPVETPQKQIFAQAIEFWGMSKKIIIDNLSLKGIYFTVN